MENVPQVIGTANMREFAKWLAFLENIGYKCYWKLLNAKNYGLPQNRNRCFMISLYGDYDFDFPEEVRLERVLKDMLEPNVPEKYYLTDAAVEQFIQSTITNKDKGNGFEFAPTNGGGIANCVTTKAGSRATDNFIIEAKHNKQQDGNCGQGGYDKGRTSTAANRWRI